MRWWDELQNPALKCERLGHAEVTETQGGMRQPSFQDWRRGVAVRFKEERKVCARCHIELTPPKETEARIIDSWSAPSSIWDTFRAEGRWIDRPWQPT